MSGIRLSITDNAYSNGREGWNLERCVSGREDGSVCDRDSIFRDLEILGGKCIQDIVDENPDILVFPYLLGVHKDDIGSQRICSYNQAYNRIYTGNLMGFAGVNDTQIAIKSRFTQHGDDHFLHYMLTKVFCPNILRFNHATSSESVFDFMLYLFPKFFNDAMKQGIFKEYRRFNRNDMRVKGAVDVSRHIKANIPFNCNVAYNTREFSYDNHVTQLIRHTIEFIKRSPFVGSILQDEETCANVRSIEAVTPSYDPSARRNILYDNRRELNHPYFIRYRPLQRLCLSILRRDKLKYGAEKDKVYGILFDGAWLWEEFLGTIFKKWGLIHAENKTGRHPIYLFEGNSYARYPDFYLDNEVVIDAKYKRMGGWEIARDDMHQIISYLHVLNARAAYIACPKTAGESSIDVVGRLNGLKGLIGQISLKIPQDAESFSHFSRLMDGPDGEIARMTAAWNRTILWD